MKFSNEVNIRFKTECMYANNHGQKLTMADYGQI